MILGRFIISGHSMQPTYQENEQVLAVRFLPIKKGDVIVFRHDSKILIKRVKSVSKNLYEVVGDNLFDSYDSRKFGKVKKRDIMGKVVWKL